MCADGVSLAGAEIYNTVGKLAGVVDSGAIIALDNRLSCIQGRGNC